MNRHTIQLIPKLVMLECNTPKINYLSFWDNKRENDFFDIDPKSSIKITYQLGKKVELTPFKGALQFSNISYLDGKWYFSSKKGLVNFAFTLDENKKSMVVNWALHHLFITLGYLEPSGHILTDYLTYELEKINKSYQWGAAANFKGESLLFFGFGRNFKTTIINILLQNGGYYIGEEFILLDGNTVYATIPNSHQFDFRESHRLLLMNDLKKRKADVSDYTKVIFLIYSNKDMIVEINQDQANIYANLFQHAVNSYYYNNFNARDLFLENKVLTKNGPLLKNRKASYYLAYFTKIDNVFTFIKKC